MPRTNRIIQCRHCGCETHNCGRFLCQKHFKDVEIRALYPADPRYCSVKQNDNMSDDEVDAMIEEQQATHPLWRPTPLLAHDPRYNEIVAAREAAGLPARHPDDHK